MPPTPTSPKAEYVLETDGTGSTPAETKQVTLKDTRGHTLVVPFAPKAKCNLCHGRGYTGFEIISSTLIACRKCYRPTK